MTALRDVLDEIAADPSVHPILASLARSKQARYVLPASMDRADVVEALQAQAGYLVGGYWACGPDDAGPTMFRWLDLLIGRDEMGRRYDSLNADLGCRGETLDGMPDLLVDITEMELVQDNRRPVVEDLWRFGPAVRVWLRFVGDLSAVPAWCRFLTEDRAPAAALR